MLRSVVSLLSGTLFGIGLAISGMMNPTRVRGFLDIFGDWDPTLAFVMGGALVTMAIAWRVQARMHSPVVCDDFSLPGTKMVDTRLIGGSALFGIGWGLGGLCPGPALASLAVNFSHVAAFVVAMIAGMAVFRLTERKA